MTASTADLRPSPRLGADADPRRISTARTRADRIYRAAATVAGSLTLVLMVVIGAFLLNYALPALREVGLPTFLLSQEFDTQVVPPRFGIASLLYGTFVISGIALLLAVPVSITTALAIAEYAPPRARRFLTALVDLLAAVPSLVYGVWGLLFLQDRLIPVARTLSHTLGYIPIFDAQGAEAAGAFASTAFIAGVVVSLMILPIATSVIREVFSQSPPAEKEAALALGSTRWGMIRTVVLPFGRGGIIGGSMLALGRALGETIAVTLIVSPLFEITPNILVGGGNSIASNVANQFGEADALGRSALLASGLALFIVTLLVNAVASFVVSRSRSGAGVDA